MQNSFYYCERNSLHFLAEPLNFFTNLLFLAFSILLIKNKKISNKSLPIILFGIGVGSMLFHSIPNNLTAFIDVFFIILFIFFFLIQLYYKLKVNIYLSYILSALFILSCYVFGNYFKYTVLKESAFYFPILLHLYFLIIFFFIFKKKRVYIRSFILIPILFSISLYLRTIDIRYCTIFPLGTHFFWHIINSIVLFLTIKFIHSIPNRASPEKPSQT